MKKLVAELEDVELDYWVARAEGYEDRDIRVDTGNGLSNCFVTMDCGPAGVNEVHYAPHRIWNHGGPIIHRERIALMPTKNWRPAKDQEWMAYDQDRQKWANPSFDAPRGPEPLVAGMRCYVMSKFGETVDTSADDMVKK